MPAIQTSLDAAPQTALMFSTAPACATVLGVPQQHAALVGELRRDVDLEGEGRRAVEVELPVLARRHLVAAEDSVGAERRAGVLIVRLVARRERAGAVGVGDGDTVVRHRVEEDAHAVARRRRAVGRRPRLGREVLHRDVAGERDRARRDDVGARQLRVGVLSADDQIRRRTTARLGPAGEQLMRFAATSALQVSCASSSATRRRRCATNRFRSAWWISEQAASVAAERITALRRFSMTSRDGGEEERGRTDTHAALRGRSSRRRSAGRPSSAASDSPDAADRRSSAGSSSFGVSRSMTAGALHARTRKSPGSGVRGQSLGTRQSAVPSRAHVRTKVHIGPGFVRQ